MPAIALSCEEIGGDDPIDSKAFEDCLLRAESGDPYAMFKIGLAHVIGYGVEINTFRAIYWYSQAVGASRATDRDAELQEASRQTIVTLWKGIQEKVRGVEQISQDTIDEQRNLITKQESLIVDLRSILDERDRNLEECLTGWQLRLNDLEACVENLESCRSGAGR